jgi:hypothetical protein
MTSRIFIAVLTAAALAACSAEQQPATAQPAPHSDPATPAAPATGAPAAAADPATSSAQSPRRRLFGPNPHAGNQNNATGVPECDSFLARYESCMTERVPAESRGPMQTALETWRGSWKTLASSPTTRSTLPLTCKAAADSARTQFASHDCSF